MALEGDSWRAPAIPQVEELKIDAILSELGTKLSTQQELKGNELANMLLRVISKQQTDHERRVEALIYRSLRSGGISNDRPTSKSKADRGESTVSRKPKPSVAKPAPPRGPSLAEPRNSPRQLLLPHEAGDQGAVLDPPQGLLPNQPPDDDDDDEVATVGSSAEYDSEPKPENYRRAEASQRLMRLNAEGSTRTTQVEYKRGSGAAAATDSQASQAFSGAKSRSGTETNLARTTGVSKAEEHLENLKGRRDSERVQAPSIDRHQEYGAIREGMKDNNTSGRKTLFVMAGIHGEETEQSGFVKLREKAMVIATNRNFEMFICLGILINSILIGIESDTDMRDPISTKSSWFRFANICFIFLFSTEILLRLIAEGTFFFHRLNPKIYWNVFDLTLVVLALLEEMLEIALSTSPDMSAARILRTMRIVRGFRIVRVFAFFRDLRIMVAGIIHSLQSLIWALLLLLSMMFLFSVCFLQFAAEEHRAHLKDLEKSLSKDRFNDLLFYYGNLPTCIYTLYCSILGGLDWSEGARPLFEMNTFLGLLFICYVAFAVLCVLNIITGVFVENANRTVSQDADMVMMEQVEQRSQWFGEVKDLFEAADTTGSGFLTAEEFKDKMQDLRMQAWLRKIGVQVEAYSAAGLFKLLDFDGDGKLDIDEFAMSLQQVHGSARSIDVARIGMECKALRKELREHSILCITIFKDMSTLLLSDSRDSRDSQCTEGWSGSRMTHFPKPPQTPADDIPSLFCGERQSLATLDTDDKYVDDDQ